MTLAQALRQAQALGLERLDAQWLLLAMLERPAQDRAWLLAHDEQPMPETAATRWLEVITQRSQGAARRLPLTAPALKRRWVARPINRKPCGAPDARRHTRHRAWKSADALAWPRPWARA